MTPIQRDIVAAIPRLRRLAASLCRDRAGADDLVQDTVERAIGKAQHFSGGNLYAWLATVMLNLFRNQRRSLSRRPLLVDVDDPAISSGLAASPSSNGESSDIVRALDRLPEEQRVVLLLRALDGLSYAEIAEAQAIPVGTVMSRLARGRETLRELTDGKNVVAINRSGG